MLPNSNRAFDRINDEDKPIIGAIAQNAAALAAAPGRLSPKERDPLVFPTVSCAAAFQTQKAGITSRVWFLAPHRRGPYHHIVSLDRLGNWINERFFGLECFLERIDRPKGLVAAMARSRTSTWI